MSDYINFNTVNKFGVYTDPYFTSESYEKMLKWIKETKHIKVDSTPNSNTTTEYIPPTPKTPAERVDDLESKVTHQDERLAIYKDENRLLKDNMQLLRKELQEVKDKIKGLENLMSIDNSTRINLRS